MFVSLAFCGVQVHAGVAAAADSVPLASLDARAVGLLLASIGLGQFESSFVVADICGPDLQELESNDELEELGVKVPALSFKRLMRSVAEVGANTHSCIYKPTPSSQIMNRHRQASTTHGSRRSEWIHSLNNSSSSSSSSISYYLTTSPSLSLSISVVACVRA